VLGIVLFRLLLYVAHDAGHGQPFYLSQIRFFLESILAKLAYHIALVE
jgi:hypothetical protein